MFKCRKHHVYCQCPQFCTLSWPRIRALYIQLYTWMTELMIRITQDQTGHVTWSSRRYQTIIFRLRVWTATQNEYRVHQRLSGLFRTNASIFSLPKRPEKLTKARIRIVAWEIPQNGKIRPRKSSSHSKSTIIYTRWVSLNYHIFALLQVWNELKTILETLSLYFGDCWASNVQI